MDLGEVPVAETEFLMDGLKKNPMMYLHEMSRYLSQNGYHAFTDEKISRALKSRGMSRMNIETHVLHLNGPEREEFLRCTILSISSPLTQSAQLFTIFSNLTVNRTGRRCGWV